MEVGGGVAERRLAEPQEALDIPALDQLVGGVDIDGKIEEIRDEGDGGAVLWQLCRLQHVQSLDDDDVGTLDQDGLIRQHVIDEMGIDRRLDALAARLHLGEKVQEPREVVALGKSLSRHQPALFQHGVREEKPVGRHELDARMARPAGKQRLEHATRGALADRDAAGEADDERHFAVALAQETGGGAVQLLQRLDIEIEQPAERQIDVDHLLDGHALGEAAQVLELGLRERHGRIGPERRPVVAAIDGIG